MCENLHYESVYFEEPTLLGEAFPLCFSALYCHSLRCFGCSRFVLVVSVPRKRPLQTAHSRPQCLRVWKCARKLWETLRRSSQNLAIWVSQRMLFDPTQTVCLYLLHSLCTAAPVLKKIEDRGGCTRATASSLSVLLLRY